MLLGACSSRTVVRDDARPGRNAPQSAVDATPERIGHAARIASQTTSLDRDVRNIRHDRVAALLHAMADAIASTRFTDAQARSEAVREMVRAFEQSPPESSEEVRVLTSAATAVLGALESGDQEPVPPSLQTATRRARSSLALLSPQVGVLAQADAVRDLMHALSDATLVALGDEPKYATPTRQASNATVVSTQVAPTFPERLATARALVLQMTRAGWSESATLAGETLEALAGALETLETAAQIRTHVRELRFQSARLLRSGELEFTRGQWAKRALFAAVFALERSFRPEQRAALAPWIENARESIQQLDERRELGFQSAAAQDAFRTVVDAFTAAALLRDRQGDATSSGP
jgi:hypothetical protein